jgi:hypothetical protein
VDPFSVVVVHKTVRSVCGAFCGRLDDSAIRYHDSKR